MLKNTSAESWENIPAHWAGAKLPIRGEHRTAWPVYIRGGFPVL